MTKPSKSAPIRVPLFVPDLGEPECDALLECIRSGWVALGPRCEELERAFAQKLGARNAVSVNSCTAALHLANLLAGVGAGDEVIVPSLTFAATANAAVYCGAKPVFADIASEDDWTISPDDIARKITGSTRAIVVMHYGGFACDMAKIRDIASERGIAIIEDACHGLGGHLDGSALGTIGEIGCFSFYSNKIMTTGEGGLLVTDDDDFADRARKLRSHGMTANAIDRMRGAQGYDIIEVGYNYRLDDIRAAVGLAQMKRLDHSLNTRLDLVARYRELLASMPGVRAPLHGERGSPAHYIFPVLVGEGYDRDSVRHEMAARGVQTSVHYPPVHQFSHYASNGYSLPVTESVAARAISLPLYPMMDFGQVELVCSALGVALPRARG